jgi:pyruvate dehydrogenase E2 component (dihydrolipoamide acetyltransferase)
MQGRTLMAMADPATLPWRRRPARDIPPGFVSPRARSGVGATATSNATSEDDGSGALADAADERIPFNRVQARAAVALVASKHTAAHAHSLVECDYSAVDEARAAHRDAFRAEEGFALTYLPFVAVAVCTALRRFPHLNASVAPADESGDAALVVHPRVGLGIAVDLSHQGLVVPAVRDADSLSVRGIARAVHDLADRARNRRLVPDDLAGGTFTITNPGGYGTYRSFAIIHQPQVAILSTDGVRRTVVADERSRLVVRPIGQLCLSFDNRVVDGAYAAAFLSQLRHVLEERDWVGAL